MNRQLNFYATFRYKVVNLLFLRFLALRLVFSLGFLNVFGNLGFFYQVTCKLSINASNIATRETTNDAVSALCLELDSYLHVTSISPPAL